jgi:DNA-binding transcriptional LysR family regulator
MEKFARQYPRVLLRSYQVTRLLDPGLRGRDLDFTLGHFHKWAPYNRFTDDFDLEVVFDDRQVVAAGKSSPWVGRQRKIDFAELVDEPWVLTEAPDSWNYRVVEAAFRTRGLRMPKISVMTFSPQVRIGMLASGHFITTLPTAVLRFHAERRSIKVLPVDLADEPCPVVIATLKNRTLNPVVERFIAHIRDFTRPMRDERAITKA